MRAIFLNSWYGKVGDKYFDFIKNQSSVSDVFCLQEITPTLFSQLEELLSDFKGLYLTENVVEALGFVYGKAIFAKKELRPKGLGIQKIYENTPKDCGFSQPFDIDIGGKEIHFNSVHGKTFPADKLDTPVRLEQSRILIDYFRDKKGPRIIGGDFNLYPDTKSVRMFEEAGYRNLIRDFNIKNTRNELSWNFYKNDPVFVKQYFADYVFVSPKVEVKSFEVPSLEISDHEPLILDFEV